MTKDIRPIPLPTEVISLDQYDTGRLNDITGVSEKNTIRRDTHLRAEKLKQSKWTQDDLRELSDSIVEQNEHLGNPKEFLTDLALIKAELKKEKQTQGGIDKEKITAEGRDLLYGLLLTRHLTQQGFAIEVGKNDQPTLHDTRKPERTAQLKGLQDALSKFEFQDTENNIFKRNDNVSDIAKYIAAAAYHERADQRGTLLDYRTGLERQINKTQSPTKDEILKSNLSASQKSFLLLWARKSEETDSQLLKINENQEKFVIHAIENFNKKSDDQNMQELRDRPLGKAIQMYGVGALGVAALYFGVKTLMGKGGFFKKAGGVILTLIGAAIGVPVIDKLIKKTGIGDALANEPKDRADSKDNTIIRATEWTKEKLAQGWEITKDGIAKMAARIQGADEWTNLVMDEKVGPEISSIPVGTMLYALANDGNDKAKLEDYKDDAELAKANTLINGLSSEKKNTLQNLLSKTWDRYKDLNGPDFAQRNLSSVQALKLPDIISFIDAEDNWFNDFLDGLSGEAKKLPGLAIMGQNAKEWGDLTLDQIERYFGLNGKGRAGLTAAEVTRIDDLTDVNPVQSSKKNTDLLKEYFEKKIPKDYPTSRETSLREFLLKK